MTTGTNPAQDGGRINCPHCGQRLTNVGTFWICPKHGEVSIERQFVPLRIFLSYGHDSNEVLVRRIKKDLEKRGHDIWFDKSEIKAGHDWRRSITERIVESHRVLSFLSKHSTRDPGVCLDEIAIAIGAKGGNIQTILVESEQDVRPPPSISHIQWLDMHEWKERRAGGATVWEQWYKAKLAEIIAVVESEEARRFAGEIRMLEEHLKPIFSDSRIFQLLKKGLVERRWLTEAIEKWLNAADSASRLFWIMGAPGVGKSAFVTHFAHYGQNKVIAVQFCEYDKPDHRNAHRIVSTLAFQIATRLPDYRKLLLTLPEITELDRKNPTDLFDYLLAVPLRRAIDGGRGRYLIVIDALDEAREDGHNELVEMLARNAPRLPDWIGIIVTSRPEKDVTAPLQGLKPFVLDTATESNRADIRDYLRRELLSHLQNRPDANQLVERILEKSEGVFLYVERFCDDVQKDHLSLDRPEQFPQGLGGIFFEYFKRQFPDPEKFRKDIRPALRAILAAREPLPVETLRRLFNWQDEELRDFTRPLASLFPVTTEAGHEVIKPYHKSLADWLADTAKAESYFVSVLEGHRLLAEHGWCEYLQGIPTMSHYCLLHLPAHLAAATRLDDLGRVILTYDWLQAKTEKTLMNELIRDYDEALRVYPRDNEPRRSLGLLRGSIHLCAHAVRLDPSQLSTQLFGRLGSEESGVIQEFLEAMTRKIHGPWLRPRLATLYQPQSQIIRTWRVFDKAPACKLLVSHDETMIAIVTRDAIHFFRVSDGVPVNQSLAQSIFGSVDWQTFQNRLGKVFEDIKMDHTWTSATECGEFRVICTIRRRTNLLRTNPSYDGGVTVVPRAATENGVLLEGSTPCGRTFLESGFTAPAILADKDLVICGGLKGVVSIWELSSGHRAFRGRLGTSTIAALAPFPNSSFLAFLTESGLLCVGTPEADETNKAKPALTQSAPEALWLTADGSRAISGDASGDIRLWDTSTGECLYSNGMQPTFQRQFRVTDDFAFAVAQGPGEDFYDGWILTVHSLGTRREVCCIESDNKRRSWTLEYASREGLPILIANLEQLVMGQKTSYVIDLLSGEVKEGNPPEVITQSGWAPLRNVSENGTSVETIDEANRVRVKLTDTKFPPLTFTPDGKVTRVGISADGSCVAVGCESGQLHFLSVSGVTKAEKIS